MAKNTRKQREDLVDAIGSVFMIIIFILFIGFLIWVDQPNKDLVKQAQAEMMQRCVKERQPPDYCSEIARKWKDEK
jgi:hypothetical protein